MDKFLKYYKEYPVFDFEAINNEGFPINILIAERGAKGKTYGLKEFIYNKYLANPSDPKVPCLWLRSLSDDAKKECKKFLSISSLPENMMKEIDLLTAETNESGGYIKRNGQEIFIMNPVSTTRTSKGTRKIPQHIVWDEFNNSIKYFSKDLVDNIMDILSSADNPFDRTEDGHNDKKLWMLGNNKGLNHPFLIEMGIEGIEDEVTKIYDDEGNPFILLLCPVYNDEQIKEINERNKNNWLFQLNKRVGTADHIYYNKSSIDDLNYIHRYFQLELGDKIHELLNPRDGMLRLHSTYKINNQYLNLYIIPKTKQSNLKTEWHVVNLSLLCNYLKRKGYNLNPKNFFAYNKDGYLIHTTNKLELEEGIRPLHNDYKLSLINQMGESKISFENQTSRSNFIELILK